jgi:hypothetical protein
VLIDIDREPREGSDEACRSRAPEDLAAGSGITGGDPRWHRYPETILEFEVSGARRIDLRRQLDSEARSLLRTAGLSRPFAVVTACNPRGRQLDDGANSLRCQALEEELAKRGIARTRADGVSADGSHREQGWALVLPFADACRLAARYQQSAIFWFDAERFWIVPVLEDSAAAVPLPLRPAEGAIE